MWTTLWDTTENITHEWKMQVSLIFNKNIPL